VTFQFLPEKKGLTLEAYVGGIKAWRRANGIRPQDQIIPNPNKGVLIGFSGLTTKWIKRIERGTGIVDTNLPVKEYFRWGYALYVGDSLKV
jgi:hypothetical protein